MMDSCEALKNKTPSMDPYRSGSGIIGNERSKELFELILVNACAPRID